jgi:hypothetical protein
VGTILESRVQVRTSSSDTGTQFYPIIRYQYRVQRQQDVNNTWQKIVNSPTGQEALEIAERFLASPVELLFFHFDLLRFGMSFNFIVPPAIAIVRPIKPTCISAASSDE